MIFRKQSLTPREYADFASRFGKIRPGVREKYKHPAIKDISFLTNVNADGTVDEFGVTAKANDQLSAMADLASSMGSSDSAEND